VICGSHNVIFDWSAALTLFPVLVSMLRLSLNCLLPVLAVVATFDAQIFAAKRGTEVTLSMVLPVFRMGLPMARTLCELKKLLKSDFKTYKKFVCDPTHVCTRCGRTSNAKKLVCKPERLGK
jgi:hypothetical protein